MPSPPHFLDLSSPVRTQEGKNEIDVGIVYFHFIADSQN